MGGPSSFKLLIKFNAWLGAVYNLPFVGGYDN